MGVLPSARYPKPVWAAMFFTPGLTHQILDFFHRQAAKDAKETQRDPKSGSGSL
jgi:hypothetical protein